MLCPAGVCSDAEGCLILFAQGDEESFGPNPVEIKGQGRLRTACVQTMDDRDVEI